MIMGRCNKVVQWYRAEVIIFIVVSCVYTLSRCRGGVNGKVALIVRTTSIRQFATYLFCAAFDRNKKKL